MSDTSDTTVIDSAPVEAADTSVDTSPVTSDSVLDTELPAGMRSFDRSYVEKLRTEAGGNRTRARELENQLAEQTARMERFAAFEGYSDDDMAVWQSLATDWKEDPARAAQTMQDIAMRVLQDPTSTAAERVDAQAIMDNPAVTEALTPERVREIAREEQTAQEAEREREAAVQRVWSTIKEAGYEEGTEEAFSVLWYANNRTEGDIAKAIEMQKAKEQSIIDRYVESMAKGGTPVRLPGGGEPASPAVEQPRNIKEARSAAEAWLAERRVQG